MRRNMNEVNKKIANAMGNIKPSDRELEQFADVMGKYQGKPQAEIEAEMNRLMNSFTKEQKQDLVKKLRMLKEMEGILNTDQMKKVDQLVRLLSK